MEVVTHFVNDTVEFYKWSLTIAGKDAAFAGCPHVLFTVTVTCGTSADRV